jgi:cytochrome c556
MKCQLVAVMATFATVAALPAAAQSFAKPEDAIKYRQSVMTVMATHFGRVAAMAQGKAPFDAGAAASNANVAVTMSKLPFVAFGEGTDKGMPTRAKMEVWSQKDKFNAAAEKMQSEFAKLDSAAKSGNLDTIKTAASAVGNACKSCHDDFRAEKPVTH